MILARAPLRICLGGGGTDLPFYCLEHTGYLLTSAIDKYIYLSLSPSLSGKTSLRHEEIEDVASVEDLSHGIVRETLKYFGVKDALNITISSSVPSGTGMGSSSTLTVALIKALLQHKNQQHKYGAYDIAQTAYHIERVILGEEGGKQDQFISSYGGIIEMILEKDGSVKINTLNLPKKTLSKMESNLALFYLGSSRKSSDIQVQVSKEAKIKHLHDIKRLGQELKDSLVKGHVDDLGNNWHEHWLAKKQLTKSISNSEIDHHYDFGLKNGALGGKLIGAGGGGFLIFYTKDKEKLIALMERKGLKYLKFSFSPAGAEIFYKD